MTKLTESDIEQSFMTNWLSLQNELNMANKIDTRNRGKALLEILRARVQNSGWSLYSICCSPSGCCPSREAIAPQGTARRVNLLQPFRLSGDYSSSIAQCVAIEHYLSRHSVPDSNTASFDGIQSLKGSYIYCLWHRHWQMATTTHTTSLKGSNRYTLRHRRRFSMASPLASLKGSDRFELNHSCNI